MPKDDHATARLHREWLRHVSDVTGLALTTLAKKIGIPPSTLTRHMAKGDLGTSTLHASTIDKIVLFSGVAPPGSAPVAAGRPVKAFAEDAAPYTAENGGELSTAVRALIAGRNGVDPWTIKTRAIELAGYLPGDVVLVDLNGTPNPGDAVCAQVYDWPNMKSQTVMRIYQRSAQFELLIPRSLDPQFEQPLVVDGERVVIKGVLLPHRLHGKVAA